MTAKSYFVNVYFDTPAPTSFSGSFITAVPEVCRPRGLYLGYDDPGLRWPRLHDLSPPEERYDRGLI